MRDPLEGLSPSGTIRTGADPDRVSAVFGDVHRAAVDRILAAEANASVYAYGSVVTGQARAATSDVDLLTIGLGTSEASRIGTELSIRFRAICRGIEVAPAQAGDFAGAHDEAYGNRVFLRHYCVRLAGCDSCVPPEDFLGDRKAARGFNGDIAQHASRWHHALESGVETPTTIAKRLARKSLLAVASLVSVHDETWTTDRATAAHRWSDVVPDQRAGLMRMLSWTEAPGSPTRDVVRDTLDSTVDDVVSNFAELIGLWSDRSNE